MFAFLHIFASAFFLWWADSFLLSIFNFTLLRFTLCAIFLVWFSINLFYWPFWLHHQKQANKKS